jgi:hypothetical protein
MNTSIKFMIATYQANSRQDPIQILKEPSYEKILRQLIERNNISQATKRFKPGNVQVIGISLG